MTSDEPPTLQYHHPDSPLFSIDYISDDKEQYRHKEITLTKQAGTDLITERESVDGETCYLIYTTTTPDSVMPDFETESDIHDWLDEHFEPDDVPVLVVVADVFRGIRRQKAEQGLPVEFYKQMELERVPVILDRVEWGEPVDDVGADLLSSFILAHPMPKANHRTGIGLLDRYLASMDDTFAVPDAGTDDEWYDLAAEFIYDSKRLVTLRRTNPVLRWAHRCGYRRVVRKEGITIDLDEVDFVRRDHYEHYTEEHRTRTGAFVEDLLEYVGTDDLVRTVDDGPQAFVDRLRADR